MTAYRARVLVKAIHKTVGLARFRSAVIARRCTALWSRRLISMTLQQAQRQFRSILRLLTVRVIGRLYNHGAFSGCNDAIVIAVSVVRERNGGHLHIVRDLVNSLENAQRGLDMTVSDTEDNSEGNDNDEESNDQPDNEDNDAQDNEETEEEAEEDEDHEVDDEDEDTEDENDDAISFENNNSDASGGRVTDMADNATAEDMCYENGSNVAEVCDTRDDDENPRHETISTAETLIMPGITSMDHCGESLEERGGTHASEALLDMEVDSIMERETTAVTRVQGWLYKIQTGDELGDLLPNGHALLEYPPVTQRPDPTFVNSPVSSRHYDPVSIDDSDCQSSSSLSYDADHSDVDSVRALSNHLLQARWYNSRGEQGTGSDSYDDDDDLIINRIIESSCRFPEP